jgi:hypothetical protein
MKNAVIIAGLLSAIVAAGLGVMAATVHIGDSMDQFIADLHRQSTWAAWAAVAAAISAGLQAAAYLFAE